MEEKNKKRKPLEETQDQIENLNKRIKVLKDELCRIKEELHQATTPLAKKVEERSDAISSINLLPEDVLMEIFQYLDFENLCRVGRVCCNWYHLTRSEEFWRKAHFKLRPQNPTILPTKTINIIKILPSCVTYLNLNYSQQIFKNWVINLADFSEILRNRCPNLQTLFVQHMRFNVSGTNLEFCAQMPKNTRVLVLHQSRLRSVQRLENRPQDFSKIEVLDLSCSNTVYMSTTNLSMMTNLKKLRLSGCIIENDDFELIRPELEHMKVCSYQDSSFMIIVHFLCDQLKVLDLERTFMYTQTFFSICTTCIHLTELYVCFTRIKDNDLLVSCQEAILPRLKIICLRNCAVTSNGINIFMKACASVEHIFVGSKDEDYPANNYSQCKSKKIQVLNGYKHCYHHQKVNYMNE